MRMSRSSPALNEKHYGSPYIHQEQHRQHQKQQQQNQQHHDQQQQNQGSRNQRQQWQQPPHFRDGAEYRGGRSQGTHAQQHPDGNNVPHAEKLHAPPAAGQPQKCNTNDLWYYPDQNLDSTIKDMIKFRVFKYVHTKEHPLHIDRKTANALVEKMVRVAQHKERKRLSGNPGRELTKQELEGRLKKFVHQEVRQRARKL